MKSHVGFDKAFASSLNLTSACPTGVAVATFKVEKEHLNRTGRLHGGFILNRNRQGAFCYLVDAVGSLSVAALHKTEFTGVSTDIHTSFVRGMFYQLNLSGQRMRGVRSDRDMSEQIQEHRIYKCDYHITGSGR